MNNIRLKVGDYIQLPKELKSNAKTLFNFGKIESITADQIIEVGLVDDNEVNRQRLHSTLERTGLTFSFFLYDIHY